MNDLTFQDLQLRYQTGRSFVVSGTGRNRIYGYRNGVMCALGDLERSEWCQKVRDLIQQVGESELHAQLLAYLKDHNYGKVSKPELEFEALKLHASRIFDNALWIGYLGFNQKYRPQVLDSVRLILVMPACCKRPGYLTHARVEQNKQFNSCPHCGRWTEISLVEEV